MDDELLMKVFVRGIYIIICISSVAKIIFSVFFTDRVYEGTLSSKQSESLAGKKFFTYSQILFVPKGIVCENSEVEDYFRSKNKKVMSYEEFEQETHNQTRYRISMIIYVLSILINIVIGILLLIWQKLIRPMLKVIGFTKDSPYQVINRKRAYFKLRYSGWTSLSENEKTWLYS